MGGNARGFYIFYLFCDVDFIDTTFEGCQHYRSTARGSAKYSIVSIVKTYKIDEEMPLDFKILIFCVR